MKAIITMLAIGFASGAIADTFGTGANQFAIDFVNIGNAGNAAQSAANRSHSESGGDGYGAVDYNYRMGTYEITIDQFAKARAADSRIGNGNEGWWNSVISGGTDAPASAANWYEAAKFANFLTTGDAYTGAYQFNGSGTLTAVDRDAAVTAFGTVYVLPSEDEWYKAAYFKPDASGYSLYSSGLDTEPKHGTTDGWNYGNVYSLSTWATGFGAEEQNGTYDMMGNVWELSESAYDGTLGNMVEDRTRRGGSYGTLKSTLLSSYRDYTFPSTENYSFGFRVAAIPEPSSIAMASFAVCLGCFIRRKFPA